MKHSNTKKSQTDLNFLHLRKDLCLRFLKNFAILYRLTSIDCLPNFKNLALARYKIAISCEHDMNIIYYVYQGELQSILRVSFAQQLQIAIQSDERGNCTIINNVKAQKLGKYIYIDAK